MAGFSTGNTDFLTRSNLWSNEIKRILEADFFATQYIDWTTDFPDGDTLNIPSIGQLEAADYVEGEAIRYTAMDTGNFTFVIDKYLQSGTYVTNKLLQDSYVMKRVQAEFPVLQARAIAALMEGDALAVGPNGQTSANSNTINGAKHRFIGSGPNETIAVEDFYKASFALYMANVPQTQKIAVLHPTAAFVLQTQPNFMNFSNNIMWEGVVSQNLINGTRFLKNIDGWDVYVSQYVKANTGSEAIDGITSTVGVNNVFFSAAPAAKAFIGSIRQPVRLESEYNKDMQREEYVTTCRYGMKLFRPESLVTIVTDTDQVYV